MSQKTSMNGPPLLSGNMTKTKGSPQNQKKALDSKARHARQQNSIFHQNMVNSDERDRREDSDNKLSEPQIDHYSSNEMLLAKVTL